jgi:hypothetical protein
MTDPLPTIVCERVGDQLRFWCTYCKAFHYHGAEPGHRVAHCHNPGSPYKQGGYTTTLPAE